MAKTWFAIDGTLEPISFGGPSYFRFPLELAEYLITHYSTPGNWIFDPFCGFGTTIVASQRLGRRAIGFEKDPGRASFAAARARSPSRVIVGDIRQLGDHKLPQFDLVFTSPPYTSFGALREQDPASDVDARPIVRHRAHPVHPFVTVDYPNGNLERAGSAA